MSELFIKDGITIPDRNVFQCAMMKVDKTTPKATISNQTPSECKIVDIAETSTTSLQYLKIGTAKYKLAGFGHGFMDTTLFNK